jgi:hypothetical protein
VQCGSYKFFKQQFFIQCYSWLFGRVLSHAASPPAVNTSALRLRAECLTTVSSRRFCSLRHVGYHEKIKFEKKRIALEKAEIALERIVTQEVKIAESTNNQEGENGFRFI